MTSQLILGNGHGIALASDSAVTMGNRRTYETSEKIFPLSSPHRLAVMHSGGVMFHGLPFGTIINEWIKSLGDVQLRSVQHYAANFNTWLLDNYLSWSDDTVLCWDVLNAFFFDFERIWNRLKRLDDPMNPDLVMAVWRDEIASAEAFDPVTPESKQVAEREFSRLWLSGDFENKNLQASYNYWFDDVAQSDEIMQLVHRYIKASLESRYPGSNRNMSKLIFVGYGSTQMVPCASTLCIYGAISQLLYSLETGWDEARRDGYGVYLVRPSGQFDAIDLFFRGFDSGFIEATKSAVSRALENVKNPEESEAASEDPMNSIGSLIEDSFFDYSESKKLSGLRRTVGGMPLASLVRTAKHLIGIQRLSLEIAGELQTVGGQVDVGTITLKDGFKWIKQKDYEDYID